MLFNTPPTSWCKDIAPTYKSNSKESSCSLPISNDVQKMLQTGTRSVRQQLVSTQNDSVWLETAYSDSKRLDPAQNSLSLGSGLPSKRLELDSKMARPGSKQLNTAQKNSGTTLKRLGLHRSITRALTRCHRPTVVRSPSNYILPPTTARNCNAPLPKTPPP